MRNKLFRVIGFIIALAVAAYILFAIYNAFKYVF
jgi:hypothetical protein